MNDDLISRKALKKAIKTECNPYGKPIIDFESGKRVLKIIDNAPTAERPKDKWGKWVISEIQCPNCSEFFQTDCYSKEELNNCPICHTKLRGDET